MFTTYHVHIATPYKTFTGFFIYVTQNISTLNVAISFITQRSDLANPSTLSHR